MIQDILISETKNKPVKHFWFDSSYLILISALVGLITGAAAIVYQKMIVFFHGIFFDEGRVLLGFLNSYYVILLPALGALAVSLIIRYLASSTRGQGVPEIMLAVQKDGILKPRLILDTSITSSIIIGSGGSAGREGPIIQIGAAIGSAIGQLLKMPTVIMKTLVACGAAGGISAAFNAPIGGVLFAQEIILGEFTTSNFVLIVISAVSSTIISRRYLGNYPAFMIPTYSMSSPVEMLFYVILGLIAGLFAVLYIRTLYKTSDIFSSLNKIPSILKPVLGGFIVGCIGLYYPQIFGVGYDTIGHVLQNKLPYMLVFALLFAKLIATSITLGSGSPGGDFAPGLYMGAMLGGAFGILVNYVFPGITAPPGAYALVGMGGVLAGQYQAPITAIIILFEMTNDYLVILPLMIVCVISSLVARKLYPETIYTEKLVRQGINLEIKKNTDIMAQILVKDVMTTEVTCLNTKTNIDEAAKLADKYTYTSFPVLKNGRLVGIITGDYINKVRRKNNGDCSLGEFVNNEFMTVGPYDTLRDAINKMTIGKIGRLPVVHPRNNNRLIGILSHRDIINAYAISRVNNETNRQ